MILEGQVSLSIFMKKVIQKILVLQYMITNVKTLFIENAGAQKHSL